MLNNAIATTDCWLTKKRCSLDGIIGIVESSWVCCRCLSKIQEVHMQNGAVFSSVELMSQQEVLVQTNAHRCLQSTPSDV